MDKPAPESTRRGWPGRAAGWVSRRNETALAAAIFALLAVAFVMPALLPGKTLTSTDYLYTQVPWSAAAPAGFRTPANTELYDPALQFTPWFEYSRRELPGGELLWNPHIAAGRPYLANMQSGVFSPFSLPSYLLPFWWSLGVTAALKLFLASFGTYLLARRLRRTFAAGLLAGAVFGFGLYVVVHLPYPLGSVYVLIPWLLLAADELVRRPGARPALAMAVLVALSLVAGHPESTLHAIGIAVVYAAFRVAWSPDARRLAPRAGAWLVGAGLAGAALAGIVLVPFTELLAHSADYGNRQGIETKLPRDWLLAAALPEYFGTPTDATGGTVQLGTVGLFIARALYAGALPLMLGLLALAPAVGRRRGAVPGLAARRFFGAVAALCICLAFGVPGLFDAVTAVPVLGHTNNTRLIVVYLLALAILAGFGLDDLRQDARAGRRLPIAVAVGVLLAPVLIVVAGLPRPRAVVDGVELALGLVSPSGDSDVVHARALFWWVLFGGAAVALVAARARARLAAATFAALAVALVCADLFRAGDGFNPTLSASVASLPTTPAIEYLKRQRPARFVAFDRGLAPNQAMRYGLYDARNYDFPIVKRYDVLWRRYVFPLPYQPGAPQWVLTLTPASLRVLGLLGVRDILVPPDEGAYARRIGIERRELGLEGLRAGYDRADGRIYRNPRALPRAFVVHAQRVVPRGDAALRAVGDPAGPDLARVALTERPLPGVRHDRPGVAAPAPSSARIVSYAPQRVVLETRSRRAGLAVLSDVDYPGWKATVNGEAETVERVDYLLRGVPVPAGRSRVVLTYEPASVRLGAWLSAAALLALLTVAALLGARAPTRGRRSRRPAEVGRDPRAPSRGS